ILADTLEALIGAVYLSAGLERAAELIRELFNPLLDAAAGLGAGLDWKTSLQELTSLYLLGPPEYAVEEAGPDHAKRFTALALVAGEEVGGGEGGSKKEAEQRAAATAFEIVRARSVAAPTAAAAPADGPGGAVIPPEGPNGSETANGSDLVNGS